MHILDNAFGLVVGIARYNNINPLPDIIHKDASDIYDTLINSNKCGYSPDNICKLLDNEAALQSLRAKFERLIERCNSESTVFIYFSGHGGRISSGEYLLPVDVDYTSAESVVRTSLSGSELSGILRRLPARKIIIFLDCCHAGGIGTPKSAVLKSGFSQSFYERLREGRGRAIIASCRDTEQSYIQHDGENSLFTKHLLGGLSGGASSRDGLIRIFQLFEYLQPRVTAENKKQHPVIQVALEDNFPVALRLGGIKSKTAIEEKEYYYDAFISFADSEQDNSYVWEVLVPYLKNTGIRIAVSGDVEEPGVFRVVGDENAIRQSKRTVIIISPQYLNNRWTAFRDVLSQTMGINEGSFRLLPVLVGRVEESRIPERIRMLAMINLGDNGSSEQGLNRLVKALQSELPTWN